MHGGAQGGTNEGGDTAQHGKEEEGVGGHDNGDMECEERVGEYGHEVCYRGIGATHHRNEKAESYGEEGDGGGCGIAAMDAERDDASGDSHEMHTVEAPCHGHVSACNPAKHEYEKKEER